VAGGAVGPVGPAVVVVTGALVVEVTGPGCEVDGGDPAEA
jgi:hypothetical protein